ncbi:Ribonuclease H domain-containing protein [Hirschfeldia incana]|nr:Ribonuclease H domain-containing protein [Hirschfeldia incana]KAJ0258934.1 Ribonuclease H domain-containing protein [Hirschfeldia incana]
MMADNTCQLCGEHQETTNHLIFQCRVSKEIWSMTPNVQVSDGSWISPKDKAGIGWILFNTEGKAILEGKAAIEPVTSPLEAEAEALRMALVQMRKLGYHTVNFYGDSSDLYDTLSKHPPQDYQDIVKGIHCPTYMKDIINLKKGNEFHFSFHKIKRSCNVVADKLAKESRITNSNYVVSWKNIM